MEAERHDRSSAALLLHENRQKQERTAWYYRFLLKFTCFYDIIVAQVTIILDIS